MGKPSLKKELGFVQPGSVEVVWHLNIKFIVYIILYAIYVCACVCVCDCIIDMQIRM